MKLDISIIGNKEKEEAFSKLNSDEKIEILKESMNSIINILVHSGVPVRDFPKILRAQATILEDKFKNIENRGKQ